ncbi:hypothetical protein WMF37_40020 [Sorangium sp. So ce291]|uniref:hypothetical protein n=1 Tax=Sorangium sp. So ce291 TaxID=3133294 RepID=UPI003F6437FD
MRLVDALTRDVTRLRKELHDADVLARETIGALARIAGSAHLDAATGAFDLRKQRQIALRLIHERDHIDHGSVELAELLFYDPCILHKFS